MAKRLGVTSKAAATPLRRSARFKAQNPNIAISSSHGEPLSSHQSNLKSTPSSANSNSKRKNRLRGKQTCEPNVCRNVADKETVLSSVCDRRRSPRLAQIGATSMPQDEFCDPKRRDCTVTGLGVEETCPQSACEISSDKVSISGLDNEQRRLRRSAKVGTISNARRMSPRLASADTESSNLNFAIKNKSKRSIKSEKHICPNEMESSDLTVCPPNAQNNAAKKNCTTEPNSNCSKGRRKSHRLAVISETLEANCLDDGIGCVSKQSQSSICENASEKAAGLASKPPLPPNQRRSKQIENRSDEIRRKGNKSKYAEESDSDYESEESPVGKKRKREESAETEAPVELGNEEIGGILDGWTEEQEIALHKAYLLARPSPHFWKNVSKMVPGKNAQECFDRIQLNFATPPSIHSKTRLNKENQIDSPFKKLNLLEPNSLKDQVHAGPKTHKVSKQKRTQNARKTLRHLLKKQRRVDQVQEADYFSLFEASPVNLPSDVKLPSDFSCKESVNLVLENNQKPGPSQNQPDPSPEVLKRVKNMELHEKYINHLHRVDARRKACVRACNKGKEVILGTKAADVKDAKTALVSEAQDFIGCFKRLQADPFGDCAPSDEDDEDDVL